MNKLNEMIEWIKQKGLKTLNNGGKLYNNLCNNADFVNAFKFDVDGTYYAEFENFTVIEKKGRYGQYFVFEY